jgi:hypothetical protein
MKLLPQLTDEEDAVPYLVNLEAFCLIEGMHQVMDLLLFNAARPAELPANAAVDRRLARDAALQAWTCMDQKFYGYVILSLIHVPMLRDRLLGTAAVLLSPRRGSVLIQAFRNDVFANANPTIYTNRLTRIRSYRQKMEVPVATAIADMNRLHAGLPAAYARTDQDKLTLKL